ncbi:hypothetical protein CLOP_g2304 [Closterium sp. NIES-67]|nr:hypothetical protein CLOP_g2304 [Closterium sp. NIES-67]
MQPGFTLSIPFRLMNAPTTFQMTMNPIFSPLIDKCVIVYLDDILIYSEIQEQHFKDIEVVFTLLQEHRLLTTWYKCEGLKDRLEILGHVVLTKGVEVDPRKIETMQAWLLPSNLQELHFFSPFFRELCSEVYPEYGKGNCTFDRPAAERD